MLLLVEGLSYVHEVIDPLSRRTGEAADLLKKAVKIISVTNPHHHDELEKMKNFIEIILPRYLSWSGRDKRQFRTSIRRFQVEQNDVPPRSGHEPRVD